MLKKKKNAYLNKKKKTNTNVMLLVTPEIILVILEMQITKEWKETVVKVYNSVEFINNIKSIMCCFKNRFKWHTLK